MGSHLIFCGPSTAGKTTLMLGLSHFESEYNFSLDKTWTTRPKRPNESDEENIFVGAEEFEKNRDRFLFDFQTFPPYEYGIEIPRPLEEKEIRMRILKPPFARIFKSLVNEPSVLCSINPFNNNPQEIFDSRDPYINHNDLTDRISRFKSDLIEANEAADLKFQNINDLDFVLKSLHHLVIRHIKKI